MFRLGGRYEETTAGVRPDPLEERGELRPVLGGGGVLGPVVLPVTPLVPPLCLAVQRQRGASLAHHQIIWRQATLLHNIQGEGRGGEGKSSPELLMISMEELHRG